MGGARTPPTFLDSAQRVRLLKKLKSLSAKPSNFISKGCANTATPFPRPARKLNILLSDLEKLEAGPVQILIIKDDLKRMICSNGGDSFALSFLAMCTVLEST